MKRCLPLLLLALALGAAASAESRLLDRHAPRGWDVLAEAPVRAADDPDLREWGVVEKHVRHYSRKHAGAIEVCSIELWIFASEAQAAAAEAGFSYPDWRIDRVANALVMAHGQRGGRRGVFPACERIAEDVRARAS